VYMNMNDLTAGTLLIVAKWRVEWSTFDKYGEFRVHRRGKPFIHNWNIPSDPDGTLWIPQARCFRLEEVPERTWTPGDVFGLVISNDEEKLVVDVFPENQRRNFVKQPHLEGVFKTD